ncbi:YolD-like family protein [Bacillus carboniphilus]|uniref:YolD-like family protein n=1 Tax=Bacillus carboniphilus TaxID=86663 RepID=A0ABN0WTZ3_9BACI
MLRDRGRIKWTSMMLPEHVKLLREWAEEDKYETAREFDEQELEEMNQLLEEAILTEHPVTLTYFKNRQYKMVTGWIHKVDPYQQTLHIKSEDGENVQIPFLYLDHIEL